MPRLCQEVVAKKLDTMTYLKFLAEPGNNACEFMAEKLEFLGIWGEFDQDVGEMVEEISWFDLDWWKEWLLSLWAPDQLYFKFVVHMLIGLCCYLLGLLTRRSRILDLREANHQERNKNSQIMQQLWKAMEENITYKNEQEKSKLALNDVKRDLQLAISEKDVVLTKNWGLERNMKIIQAERDALDGKIKNILSLSDFGNRARGAGAASQQGPVSSDDLKVMTTKFTQLQQLVKELLRTHRDEKANIIEAIKNGSGI